MAEETDNRAFLHLLICAHMFHSPFPWQMFKYDRFLNEDKTVKKEFYKDEKKLKYFTMPWGAGKKICVGKEFAVTSIKQWVWIHSLLM